MSRYDSPRRQGRSFPSSRDLFEIGVCTIGGAALGAGLMYLFDPDIGRKRRQAISDAAATAVDSTTESLSSVAGRLRAGATDSAQDSLRNLSKAQLAQMAYATASD